MESYVIGNIQIYPPTLATRQVLILRYLTPMGEYQEVNKHANGNLSPLFLDVSFS
jgi:HIV-1 Vpr-binding protein